MNNTLSPIQILFEDEVILVVNKPNGLMVEPDRNNYPNLLQQVKQYLKASQVLRTEHYAQHIHRLDRPVSGIVLFAKQRSVLKNLSEQFAERKVKKHYQALTSKAPLQRKGVLEHWHRKEKKKAVLVSEDTLFAEKVKLEYEVFPYSQDLFLWKIALHTGKFHQIRVQLASLACPILGDELYGDTGKYAPNAIALHASQLVFSHPVTGENLSILADPQWV